MKVALSLVLTVLALIAPSHLSALPTTIDFSSGFVNPGAASLLQFNGSAQNVVARARLTAGAGGVQAGTVWTRSAVDIRRFSCQFTFQLAAGSGFGDGFTFAIQGAGSGAVGGGGGSLGYAGITPSVAIKFDTYPNSSTTGLYLNGANPSDSAPASIDMAASGIDLQSGRAFNVLLTYDSTTLTLHQVVTDTQTSDEFVRDYVVDLPGVLGSGTAFLGFSGGTGGATSTQDILTWSYTGSPPPYDVQFSSWPKIRQLYPRNRALNSAAVGISGTERAGGFSQAVLRVYREGVQVGAEQVQSLVYAGGAAPFSFTATIPAELASYDLELLLRDGVGGEFIVKRAEDIVAGDVFVIQGQSNADAQLYSGSANSWSDSFIRTFGLNTDDPTDTLAETSWLTAKGDGSRYVLGGVGQWGLILGSRLIQENGVPVAIVNGAHPGQPIGFFQRNDASPMDVSTNYGRLLYRMQEGGLDGAVRAILYYQGENDGDPGQAAVHEAGYIALRSDWMEDYPSVERLYIVQVREGCGVTRFDVDLRNRQRLMADRFSNVSVMSSNGLNGHDGCHFSFANGYEKLGFDAARLLRRDLYGAPSLPNIDAPNPGYAVLTGAGNNVIRIRLRNPADAITFDAGAAGDFAVTKSGAPVSVVSGSFSGGDVVLQLSGNATGATAVSYTGHTGSGPWVRNANGIGLLSFIEPIATDTSSPVITLTGANPQMINASQPYSELGATGIDALDGDISGLIVIDSSSVNTAAPGSYLVTYNLSDLSGNVAATVTRTVNVVNSPPVNTLPGPQAVAEDTVLTISGVSVSDADGNLATARVSVGDGTLTVSLVGGAAISSGANGSGTLTLSGTQVQISAALGTLSYMGNPNFTGTDTLTVVSMDSAESSLSDTDSVTINVIPVNDTPLVTRNDASVTVNEGSMATNSGTFEDKEGNGTVTLTASVGTVTKNDLLGTWAWSHAPTDGPEGSTTVVITATDSGTPQQAATANFTLVVANAAPTALNQSTSTDEDTAKMVTLAATDPGSDSVSYEIVSGPSVGQGTLGTVSGNQVMFTPAMDFVGNATFMFRAADNDGAVSNVATVTINVTDKTAPVVILLGDNPFVVAVGGAFADPGAMAEDNVDGDVTNGIVTSGGPVTTNTPGSFTLSYNVSDAALNPAIPVTRTVLVLQAVAPVLEFERQFNALNNNYDAVVIFTTAVGLEYTLFGSSELGNWMELSTIVGNGSEVEMVDEGRGSNPSRFYKVRVKVKVSGP